MNTSPLRRILRLAAAIVLVAGVGLWAATGAHRGWTKTEITEMQRDEVTGIDFPVTRDGLVAGVDIVALSTGAAAALFGLSFLVGRQAKKAASA